MALNIDYCWTSSSRSQFSLFGQCGEGNCHSLMVVAANWQDRGQVFSNQDAARPRKFLHLLDSIGNISENTESGRASGARSLK